MQQRWLEDLAAGRPFVLRANDVTTQIQGARSGLGAVLLPHLLGDAKPDLIRLEIGQSAPPHPLWLSIYADMRRSPVAKAVIDHLTGFFDT